MKIAVSTSDNCPPEGAPTVPPPENPEDCRQRVLAEVSAKRQDGSTMAAIAAQWIVARCQNCRACLPG